MINRPESVYNYMFAGLLVLQAILLFYWASFMPIASTYEAEIIMAAEEMVKTGNWLWPRPGENQVLTHTPILPYWFAAIGHGILPNSLLGYRLLHILLYILAFTGFFRAARKFLDGRTAFFGTCVLVACLPFSWQMQLASPDSLLTIFVCAALLGFYLLLKTNSTPYFWLLYGSFAAGVLTKGLVGLFLPLLIMVVYLMFKIKFNGTVLQKLMPVKGFLLVLLMAFPWFIYAGFQQDGKWIFGFLNEYHWQRYFADHPEAKGAFYWPFLYIILMLLPWGILLPKSFSLGWKYRHKKDFLLLSILSLLSVLIFYAFSGTFFPHYLLPALPFAAVLIGFRFNSLAGRSLPKMKIPFELGLLILLAIFLPIGCWYILIEDVKGGWSLTFLFILLLAILPLGTIVTFLLWGYKRMDEGFSALAFSYFIFFALLLTFAQINSTLGNYLQVLLY